MGTSGTDVGAGGQGAAGRAAAVGGGVAGGAGWSGLGVRSQLTAGWSSVAGMAQSAVRGAEDPPGAQADGDDDAPEMSAESDAVKNAKHGAKAAADGAWRAMGWLGRQFEAPEPPPQVGGAVPSFLKDQVPKPRDSPSAEDL